MHMCRHMSVERGQEERLIKTRMQMELKACSLLPVAEGMHEVIPRNIGEEGIGQFRKLSQDAQNPLCLTHVLSQYQSLVGGPMMTTYDLSKTRKVAPGAILDDVGKGQW